MVEATYRMADTSLIDIDATVMLITSFISLLCNIWNLIVLDHCAIPCYKQTGFMDSVESVYKPHGGHSCGGHGHGDHGHSHGGGNDHADDNDHGHDHGHSHGGNGHDHDNDEDHDHAHDHGHSHAAPAISRKEENLNIKAAVVHAIGDLLQSIGVIIASVVITIWPNAKIVDPICTYIFSIIVMFTTIPVFKACVSILMEQ